jgi:hypothetical protein
MRTRATFRLVVFGLAVACPSPLLSAGRPELAWVARYDQPCGGVDWAAAIAVDGAGNVIVTGTSASSPSGFPADFITVKYDPSGKELWTAAYDGPGHENDRAAAVAVDAAGNIYVAGSSQGEAAFGTDMATVKYDPDGKELWVDRYDGPSHIHDLPAAIAIDGDGSVYAIATETSGDEVSDIDTIKYDAGGSRIWTAHYNYTYEDRARDIAPDGAGGVYVLGHIEDFNGHGHTLLRYGPDGDLLWEVRGAGELPYHRGCLAVDGAGDAYVTATAFEDGTVLLTVRYDRDGNRVWEARHPVGSGYAGVVAVDAEGNARVAGWTYFDTPRLLVLGLDPQGNEVWTAGGDPIDQASTRALALDAAGSAIVACSTPTYGFFVAKYGPAGEALWSDAPPGTGNWEDGPQALALGPAGTIHVTGGITSTETGLDYATRKYDPQGNRLWEALENGFGHGHEGACQTVFLPDGGIAVSGSSTVPGRSTEIATIKYGRDGTVVWTDRYLPPGTYANVSGLSAGPGGSLYLSGTFTGPDSLDDFVVIRYDAAGNRLWEAIHEATTASHTTASGIAVDAEGNAWVSGFDGGMIAEKYGPDGARLWTARYPWEGQAPYSRGEGIALDAEGNAYVCGTAGNVGANSYYVTVKYDRDGNQLWEARHDPHPGPDYGWRIAVAHGAVYVAGSTGYGFRNVFSNFVAYDLSGNILWTAGCGAPDVEEFAVTGIAADAAGNFLATGHDEEASDPGNRRFATLKFDPAGNLLWKALSDGEEDSPRAIAADAAGNIYVTGDTDNGNILTLQYSPDGHERWGHVYGEAGLLITTASDLAVDASGNIAVAATRRDRAGSGDYVTLRYSAGATSPAFLRGDCDGGASVDITDAVFLLTWNFLGGEEPPCLAACDANADGQVSGQVTDAVYLLRFLFLGGPPPAAPFPACGAGAADPPGCAAPPGC